MSLQPCPERAHLIIRPILRRLCEPGAFLVEEENSRVAVYRPRADGNPGPPTILADVTEARRLLAEGMIERTGPNRFEVTEAARASLRAALAGKPADMRTFEGRARARLQRMRRKRGEIV